MPASSSVHDLDSSHGWRLKHYVVYTKRLICTLPAPSKYLTTNLSVHNLKNGSAKLSVLRYTSIMNDMFVDSDVGGHVKNLSIGTIMHDGTVLHPKQQPVLWKTVASNFYLVQGVPDPAFNLTWHQQQHAATWAGSV